MYVGINKNKGINVTEEDAYDYAKTHLDDMDIRMFRRIKRIYKSLPVKKLAGRS